ncbi:LysR family transcriptional regulator [Staphylococcus massiliensis]|uniref:LysR family transcriptional regulator n=1 Tax=Staphylococcus massiliensis S46 TaxID=1229783 RepID=K9ANP9_9STAP|nr:LysR family transcriptional regulator [Staphylococcus massiliensis]EKU49008.1 LysR family transcriptional regulator [Staphylococcus massiliensis S46]MCG3399451.1 LysR family transcriptional regulator [Staphylococcus massiliensis]MCG3402450.1 LysR family transcriptional regulator [Staphylococcus massiliensis]MCG3411587.1 LysR family transcriptional regulator [Staphylococcus massiliensis]PNZ99484.1 LysR family transcriptional regulator [Staphylococcus massiliensis CCUG 55927]
MKIIQLEYFIAIVKYNSFTKAAQFLHISQPSLTATIKKMEEDLGYELLTRSTKAIKITEKGIQFYNYATELVQEYHQTLEKMHDLNFSHDPKIKMSILESTSRWVPLVIHKHRQSFPDQHYQISEVLDPEITIQQLLKFDIHIGLTNDQIKHEDITSIPLYEEDYVIVMPEDKFPNQRSISIKNLPLILPNKQYRVRKHLNDYFKRLNIRANIVMEVDRFEAATNFVHQHLGYAVIPRVYYQSFNTSKLKTLRMRPNLKRTIYINYLKKRKHSEQVLSLVNLCREYWDMKSNTSHDA